MPSNRQELDPIPTHDAVEPLPRTSNAPRPIDSPELQARLDQLVRDAGAVPGSTHERLVRDLLLSGLKLLSDGRDTGELKLIAAAVKELRHAYRVFGQYPAPHKVTIFGSARTPRDHPDFAAAVQFGRLMAAEGWMVITGAGGGIMEAGNLGPGRERSFGVAIRLPFEQATNDVIAGDSKLITFRYFFTRKLMFISQSEAVALFPGGFGTMDEGFEVLTLIQTGKASIIPIVMIEGPGGSYWSQFDQFIRAGLADRGWVSPEDLGLFTIAQSSAHAARIITDFYRVYHSSRYVRDDLVIRLNRPITPSDAHRLADAYRPLIARGTISLSGPLPPEDDHLDLPRLVFTHTRRDYGLLRRLIDDINLCPPP
ncbi:MAG: hypothetical protein C0475_05775 [Planctomyces sp.]|nr:hypothetical protein [Planctomyces sp.]